MNELSGGEALVRMLQQHGVEYIFGLCGDTSLPFYDALYRLDHGITHILTRDERSAAYMADAYARVSGRVGVCEGPSGGGATYILPGVVEAGESSIPVLAINTDISVAARGRFPLTELDQQALFRPLTKWNAVIDSPAQLPGMVRAAFRHMTTGVPGSAHLGLPFDVQKAPVNADDIWADPALGRFPARRMSADPAQVEQAAALLLAARQPLIICGGGPVIAGAFEQVQQLAERLAAPVATSISGQGIIADTHPLALGVVGSNGGVLETRQFVETADLVLFIGCRAGSVTTERWRFPQPRGCRIVQIDADPATIGVNYPVDAALAGDARLVLQQLLEAMTNAAAPDSVQAAAARVAAAKAAKWAKFQALADSSDRPIKPERVVAALQAVLPDDAVLVADPGTPCPYLSAYYTYKQPGRQFITNRAHGALGFALPAVIGAAFGRPGAKCVAVMGDGSFGFAAGEMETLVRLRLPVTLVVISNSVFGWIKAGQKSGFGERYFSVDFERTDHARVAEAFGLKAWRVEDPADLQRVLAQAVASDGPTLVDVICQPLHEAAAPVSEWVA
ncbi:MAG: thiamine pyrophosphate-binding protein [Gammaproteobacteria bacterium]